MTAALAEMFPDSPPPIDPAEAMLFAVAAKHAEVVWLRARVTELDESALTWGVTREKDGGGPSATDNGTTYEAKPNVWWTMLRTAEDQLVKFAAAARAAGCEEARVRLAEGQGALVADVLRAVLDDMLTALTAQLRELGLQEDVVVRAITEAWSRWVSQIVPTQLRRLGGA